MSYADMAAKGPKQTDEEKMPDYVPEIAHSDSGVHSLDTLSSSSSHEQSFPSYAEQQLAAERREAAATARRDADRFFEQATREAQDFTSQAKSELSRLEKQTGTSYSEFSSEAKASYEEWKSEASKEYEKVKKEAKKDGKKAKEEAKKAERWAEENKGNPVVIGNAVVIATLGALLGIGAYRLHQRNELTWKVAGTWAGIVGLFAVGDYYVSQHFFKKYPPKR